MSADRSWLTWGVDGFGTRHYACRHCETNFGPRKNPDVIVHTCAAVPPEFPPPSHYNVAKTALESALRHLPGPMSPDSLKDQSVNCLIAMALADWWPMEEDRTDLRERLRIEAERLTETISRSLSPPFPGGTRGSPV